MLRTASHSASEAAERTVRPWILWTLLRRLSKARRGTVFYSLSPPPLLFPSLSPQAPFYSCFRIFHTHSLYPHAFARTSPLSINPQVLSLSCWPPPSQSLKLGIYSRKTETRSSFYTSTFRPFSPALSQVTSLCFGQNLVLSNTYTLQDNILLLTCRNWVKFYLRSLSAQHQNRIVVFNGLWSFFPLSVPLRHLRPCGFCSVP